MNIKDINGDWVIISDDDLFDALMKSDFKLLGMSVPVIARLQQHYMEYAGPMPMTIDNVDGFLNRGRAFSRERAVKDDHDA